MAVAALACADCGAQFIHSGSRGRKPTRCQRCTGEHRSAIIRAWRERNPLPPKTSADLVLHPCQICGKGFLGRVTTMYCSVTCRGRAKGVKPAAEIWAVAATRQQHECKQCRSIFSPKAKGRTSFCSRQCAYAHKTANRKPKVVAPRVLVVRHCVDCDATISAGKRCATCSRERTLKAGREKYYQSRGDVRCPDCGAAIPNDGSYQRRCVACRASRERSVIRAGRQVRRHRERAATVERFDPIEVLRRDGWRCHLCGRRTPESKRGTYANNAPELDHIVPLAKGGAHSRANTACACRQCNIAKSDKIIGQMSLLSA